MQATLTPNRTTEAPLELDSRIVPDREARQAIIQRVPLMLLLGLSWVFALFPLFFPSLFSLLWVFGMSAAFLMAYFLLLREPVSRAWAYRTLEREAVQTEAEILDVEEAEPVDEDYATHIVTVQFEAGGRLLRFRETMCRPTRHHPEPGMRVRARYAASNPRIALFEWEEADTPCGKVS